MAGNGNGNGRAGKKRITFRYTGDPGRDIRVTGTFNEWSESRQMADLDGDGHYELRMFIPPGQHEYKFLVNGEWHIDPDCTNWVPNEHGTLNSVIKVG